MTPDSRAGETLWESLPGIETPTEAQLHLQLLAVNKGLNVWGAIYAECTWAL
jgi:hypothetical protein